MDRARRRHASGQRSSAVHGSRPGRGLNVHAPRPDRELNAAGIGAIIDRDCKALADQIESAVAEFVAAVRITPGDPKVAYHAGILLPVSSVTAILLGEMLVHGHDIAQASRHPWLIAPEDAGLVLRGALTMLPYFVDRAAAAGVRASFDIRLRGKDGPRVYLAFDDGSVNVGRSGRSLNVEEVQELLASSN
jgi:hypothetical protein